MLKVFLAEDQSTRSPKQNVVTFSDGSQIAMETIMVDRRLGQRRHPKSVLTAQACDYLTTLGCCTCHKGSSILAFLECIV